MKRIATVLAIGLFCATSQAAQTVKHDGSWWKEKSGIFKEAFVVGYEEGIAQSESPPHHADWGIDRTQPIVQGLNAFYGDFRNLKIHVDEAILYVIEETSGKTDEELAPELQRLRSTAAKAGEQ